MQRYYGNLKLGALRMLCMTNSRMEKTSMPSSWVTRFPPPRLSPWISLIGKSLYPALIKRKVNLGCGTAPSRLLIGWRHAQPRLPGGLRTVSVTVTLNFLIHTLNAALMSACSR